MLICVIVVLFVCLHVVIFDVIAYKDVIENRGSQNFDPPLATLPIVILS